MATDKTRESGSRKRIVLPLVALGLIAGLVWAGKTWAYGQHHESTDDAQVEGRIVPVLAKVGGYVAAVGVDDNQPIKEGALAVRIDDAEYRVRVEQAQAQLAAARAATGTRGQEGQANARVQSAAGEHAALQAQIEAAAANERKAQGDLTRVRDLAAKQIVSRQQLDAAQAAADAARAALLAAHEQATAAEAGVSSAKAGVRVAEADLAGARATLDNATLQLGYTAVRAPASGIVSKKQVELGQLVQPGQPLFSIVADSGVWITANLKETQLANVHVGQSVDVEVDAYQGCHATGRVESLSGATGARFALLPPDNATGNFTKVVQRVPIRIAITHGCGERQPLRPGMSTNIHIQTD